MLPRQYDPADADEFLENVDSITKRVQDILDGKTDCIEEEERYQDE